MENLTARQLNEAIFFLGLTDVIKPVTPYASAGEMLQHVIATALAKATA